MVGHAEKGIRVMRVIRVNRIIRIIRISRVIRLFRGTPIDCRLGRSAITFQIAMFISKDHTMRIRLWSGTMTFLTNADGLIVAGGQI